MTLADFLNNMLISLDVLIFASAILCCEDFY